MNKYTYEAKLALITSVLGFFVVIFLKFLGLLIGFFLLLIGLYLGLKIKKNEKKNELANISVLFSLCGFIFILIILCMMIFVNLNG